MPTITDRVDALFKHWDTPNSPGCVLAVIKNGEFIYTRGYGMADLERGIPITEDSIFDIGSTGKQFTATVIAILANQGLFRLDNTIRQHLPEMPAYADQITIQHLIQHTSGIRDYDTLMHLRGMPSENIYAEDFLFDLIVRQKGLNFTPGSEYLYSNSGYFLLGIIAQRVTGKHITELINAYILDPLGMKNTTFNRDYRPIVKNRAMSYDTGENEGTFVNAVALSGGFGDGPILTNIKDFLLWDRNFYDNKLNNAQPDLIEQLHRTGTLNNGKSINYAFGLEVTKYKGRKVVQHAGGWAGYRTELMRFPDQHFSVVCISNLGSIEPTMLCRQVADIYLEDVFNAQQTITNQRSKPRALSTAELEGFTGVYQGKQATFEISITDDVLYFSNGAHTYSLRPLGKKKFQLEGQLASFTFSGRQNENLKFNDDEEQTTQLKRVRRYRFTPPALSHYTGDYYNSELDIHYSIGTQNDSLQLKRNPFDKFNPLYPFTEDTFLCEIGEIRLREKNGSIKGFTLNAWRVRNIKFRKLTRTSKTGEMSA